MIIMMQFIKPINMQRKVGERMKIDRLKSIQIMMHSIAYINKRTNNDILTTNLQSI